MGTFLHCIHNTWLSAEAEGDGFGKMHTGRLQKLLAYPIYQMQNWIGSITTSCAREKEPSLRQKSPLGSCVGAGLQQNPFRTQTSNLAKAPTPRQTTVLSHEDHHAPCWLQAKAPIS